MVQDQAVRQGMEGTGEAAAIATEVKPRLSVVIPMYNEARRLASSIPKLTDYFQGQGYTYEYVVVDDGSSDGSREILSEMQTSHPHIRVLLQPRNMGKGAALRRGIQESTGDFVSNDSLGYFAITDDDQTLLGVEPSGDLSLWDLKEVLTKCH